MHALVVDSLELSVREFLKWFWIHHPDEHPYGLLIDVPSEGDAANLLAATEEALGRAVRKACRRGESAAATRDALRWSAPGEGGDPWFWPEHKWANATTHVIQLAIGRGLVRRYDATVKALAVRALAELERDGPLGRAASGSGCTSARWTSTTTSRTGWTARPRATRPRSRPGFGPNWPARRTPERALYLAEPACVFAPGAPSPPGAGPAAGRGRQAPGGMRMSHADLLKRLRERAAGAHPPATAEAVASAEGELGFRLPRLLRAVYRLVGNGGFGPGCGLIGVPGTEPYSSGAESVVDLYDREVHDSRGAERRDRWPERVLPFCDYGCGSFACVACSRPAARVLRFDCDAYLRMAEPRRRKALRPESRSLAEWFEAWLAEKPA
jgi:hypothetical protein